MSNIITPQIRFAGFTDAWEQREFEEVITVGNGMDYKHLSEGDIPVYGTGGYMLSVDKALSYDKDAIGIGRKGTIDKPYILKAPFWTVDTLFYCIPKEEYSLDFVYCVFQNVNWKEKDESTGVPSLSKVNINSTGVKVPALAEQEKIGEYFSNLDSIITLHQRKCDALQKFKKSMLQKMFPQNGESVPEIRFAGFTDAWEQRKFSEGVSEIGDGLHGTPTYCDDGNVYFINGNNLVDGRIMLGADTKKVDESQQSIADKNLDNTTILMSINGTIGNLAYYSGEKLMLGKSAAFMKISEFDKRFIYAYLQAPSVQDYFKDSLTGTTIKNLGLKSIREMVMFIPQYEEQKRIGEFLYNLDNLITLHQRKLETLQKMKKSLLQKMFV